MRKEHERSLQDIARAAQIEASEEEFQAKILAPLRLTASNRARALLKAMEALLAANERRPARPEGAIVVPPKGLFSRSQVRKLVRENPGMRADAINAFSTPELFAQYLHLLLLRFAYDRSRRKRGRGRPTDLAKRRVTEALHASGIFSHRRIAQWLYDLGLEPAPDRKEQVRDRHRRPPGRK